MRRLQLVEVRDLLHVSRIMVMQRSAVQLLHRYRDWLSWCRRERNSLAGFGVATVEPLGQARMSASQADFVKAQDDSI